MGSTLAISEFIRNNLDDLTGNWLDAIVGTYSDEAAGFIKGKQDRIQNPMGYAIKEMVESVLGCLASGCDDRELESAMYPVIQMRAVQGFSPSEAVSFILLLRDSVSGLARKNEAFPEIMLEFDEAVIGLMSRAFDIYSGCREKLSEIKQEELKRNLYMLLRKSDMVELRKGSE